jgi:hypothetical protein
VPGPEDFVARQVQTLFGYKCVRVLSAGTQFSPSVVYFLCESSAASVLHFFLL